MVIFQKIRIMNCIIELIRSKESDNFRFIPDPNFYKKVGIRRKRWGQLIRNEQSPTLQELQAISNFFNVKVTNLLENSKNFE